MSESKPENQPEPWLRGPVRGVAPELQPLAHSLQQVAEDVARAVDGLSATQLQARPGGAASPAFHLRHIPGSLDRLITYARGAGLSEAQRTAASAEKDVTPVEASVLLAALQQGLERAQSELRAWPVDNLLQPRSVGRAGLPSTVLGLLFHAAEHAQRHTGQLIATAKVVRGA